MMKFDTEQEAFEYAEKIASAQGFVDFEGQNCEDDCRGWDGFDRRCDCGNRRVEWETEKTSDGKFYAVARAW